MPTVNEIARSKDPITLEALLSVGFQRLDGKLMYYYGQYKGEYLFCYHDPRDDTLSGFADGHTHDKVFPAPLNMLDVERMMDHVRRYFERLG